MKNFNSKKIASLILAGAVLAVPMIALGGGTILGKYICSGTDCEFNNLIDLANTIISFLIYDVAVPLAALGFMYAGARMVLYQNKEKEWTAAKEMMTNIGYGFAIMLGSFVLIKFVLYQFLDSEAGFTLYLLQ